MDLSSQELKAREADHRKYDGMDIDLVGSSDKTQVVTNDLQMYHATVIARGDYKCKQITKCAKFPFVTLRATNEENTIEFTSFRKNHVTMFFVNVKGIFII